MDIYQVRLGKVKGLSCLCSLCRKYGWSNSANAGYQIQYRAILFFLILRVDSLSIPRKCNSEVERPFVFTIRLKRAMLICAPDITITLTFIHCTDILSAERKDGDDSSDSDRYKNDRSQSNIAIKTNEFLCLSSSR